MHGKKVDRAMARRYWDTLQDRMTDEQFLAACERLETADWFPTPARILTAGRPALAVVENATDVTLYERVVACQSYNPHSGSGYSQRQVAAELGAVAAALFQAAGGAPAFLAALRNPEREPFVRRDFLQAARAVREDPEGVALLTGGSVPALPAGSGAV